MCKPDCDHCAFQASLTVDERNDMDKMNAAMERWKASRFKKAVLTNPTMEEWTAAGLGPWFKSEP